MLLLSLLYACTAANDSPKDDTGTACTASTGTLRVCVWMEEGDEAPLPGVKAWIATNAEGTDGIQTVTGADGCADFDLDAGEWWAWGYDETQNCRSWPEAVEVTACETTTYDAYVYMGCLDG
ncbi:MAG: hypothetical protein Q8P18_02050 [Pseudomonadota bacterium]|nr:hypothetical protein [Pseudomonadota bacterium]